jgi:hypothetical protein
LHSGRRRLPRGRLSQALSPRAAPSRHHSEEDSAELLLNSSGRVVLWIEVEHDPRAAKAGQADALARLVNEVEVRSSRAFLDHLVSVRNVRVATVLGLHQLNAVLVITVNLLAFGWGGIYLWRKRYPGRLYAHALALGQSLLIAQVALGLLLLSDGRRAPDKLHYAYGTFALLAALSPWLYAPPVPARRLAWFVGATLLATALSVRAFTTA